MEVINTLRWSMSYDKQLRSKTMSVENIFFGIDLKISIADIDDDSIRTIIKFVKVQFNDKLKLLVIDIRDYPRIASYVDDGSNLSISKSNVEMLTKDSSILPVFVINKFGVADVKYINM